MTVVAVRANLGIALVSIAALVLSGCTNSEDGAQDSEILDDPLPIILDSGQVMARGAVNESSLSLTIAGVAGSWFLVAAPSGVPSNLLTYEIHARAERQLAVLGPIFVDEEQIGPVGLRISTGQYDRAATVFSSTSDPARSPKGWMMLIGGDADWSATLNLTQDHLAPMSFAAGVDLLIDSAQAPALTGTLALALRASGSGFAHFELDRKSQATISNGTVESYKVKVGDRVVVDGAGQRPPGPKTVGGLGLHYGVAVQVPSPVQVTTELHFVGHQDALRLQAIFLPLDVVALPFEVADVHCMGGCIRPLV